MSESEVNDLAISPEDTAVHSGSESEPEEMAIECKPSTTQLYSTPQGKTIELFSPDESISSSSEDDEFSMETSNTCVKSKYDSFTSFLKMNLLDSDSENEKQKDVTSKVEDSSSDLDNSDFEDHSVSEGPTYTASYNKHQNQAYKSCRLLLEAAGQGIKIHYIPEKNAEVILLPHPSSVTLRGYLRVSVLLGRASILGCEIPEGKPAMVLSVEGSTLLNLSTVTSATKHTILNVKKTLNGIFGEDQEDIVDDFLTQIGSSTVIVILQRQYLPPSLRFLKLYFHQAVQPLHAKNLPLCSLNERLAFTVSPESEWLADEINRVIRKSTKTECGPRIAVCGPKNSGKSSLLRYLINRALNQCTCVYYLDIDPGQTEFTPPGTVSLTRVTEPLLGPPFSHNRNPLKMVFTGAISPASSPPMYIKSVKALIEIYKSKFAKYPLFVNTMGWIEGIGKICLAGIFEELEPTIKIELISPDVLTEMKKVKLSDNCTSYCMPAWVPVKSPVSFTPRDLRNFALVSYLGRCQKFYMETTYLNAFRPVTVCWDNIAVYIMNKKIPPNRLIEAIHCSVVALCRVSKELILESDKKEFPRTLVDEPLHECVGFGFVRASDEKNHLFYIVTPLSLDQLKHVNALIKGDVLLPDAVFLKQPIVDVPLPYTDGSKGVETRKRVRTLSHKNMPLRIKKSSYKHNTSIVIT